ncbi:endonuclease III [Bartonella doshiae]|uniref:Endonuclease III n=2 Tax=Bartonella doshiae TaxID=33044 RepID=A0A380ZIY8_BARDO|nr:endonuclease III [Bartonella doshiae]EJF80320.1 endonuclease III [Bartonella doshiae NCTC 12862 = ATCC 700133]MBB6158625.1 endonuclease-3 [Bartonella doshiae]SUV46145.1 Endonuclease III [Bartonella doshiae]
MTQSIIKSSKARKVAGILYSEDEIEEIFRRFSVQRPFPKSDLIYTNAFTLLVAVVLSAQATDASVNKATKELFRLADKPEKMIVLGEEEIARHIRAIGLWRAKARNVYALCNFLINQYGGQVPDNREALMALPGVGRKTANVVLNVAFGRPTMAVDTHIFRLGNRLGLAPGKTPEIVEKKLLKIIPVGYLRHAHHWLILHGRYICQARKVQCAQCIIADLCKATIKTNTIPAPLVEVQGNGPPIFF